MPLLHKPEDLSLIPRTYRKVERSTKLSLVPWIEEEKSLPQVTSDLYRYTKPTTQKYFKAPKLEAFESSIMFI